MIKVQITAKDNNIKKINIKGHADYDDYGKDIVCSSVSSITITTVNAILMFDKNYISYNEKKDNFEIIINENNDITNKLIDNMINMITELSQDYPKNIKIEEED
ncbi:MAG: ribosomal-processing cysteine protease Prp [Bacilli bacterium]|nr:ribosomal-processing cysteine protease Prp [Bacilli bacterium]